MNTSTTELSSEVHDILFAGITPDELEGLQEARGSLDHELLIARLYLHRALEAERKQHETDLHGSEDEALVLVNETWVLCDDGSVDHVQVRQRPELWEHTLKWMDRVMSLELARMVISLDEKPTRTERKCSSAPRKRTGREGIDDARGRAAERTPFSAN